LRLGLILVVVALLPCVEMASGQELLSNGTFDTGIEGWTVDTVVSPGTIDWASAQGLPPGALRFPTEDQFALPQECFHMAPGVFEFSADVFMETAGEFVDCHINYYLYVTNDDCTGDHGWFINVGGNNVVPIMTVANEWERLEFNLPMDEESIATGGFPSIRPVLVKSGDLNADDACLFDNVSFRFVPEQLPVTAVPSLGAVGLWILGGLLAVAGFVLIRRGLGG